LNARYPKYIAALFRPKTGTPDAAVGFIFTGRKRAIARHEEIRRTAAFMVFQARD